MVLEFVRPGVAAKVELCTNSPEAVRGLKAQLLFGVLAVVVKLKHLSFLKRRLLR